MVNTGVAGTIATRFQLGFFCSQAAHFALRVASESVAVTPAPALRSFRMIVISGAILNLCCLKLQQMKFDHLEDDSSGRSFQSL